MIDSSKLKKLILEEVGKRHKLGEQVGGSGHLGYVHLTRLDIEEPTEVEFGGEKAYEIPFTFETYTESEFHYATDDDNPDDMYRRVYHARIIVDDKLKVLDYMDKV